jgi:hypothetical protein
VTLNLILAGWSRSRAVLAGGWAHEARQTKGTAVRSIRPNHVMLVRCLRKLSDSQDDSQLSGRRRTTADVYGYASAELDLEWMSAHGRGHLTDGLQNRLWESQALPVGRHQPETSPLYAGLRRAGLPMGMWERKLCFDQPDDVNLGLSHVVVHVVIRGFETARNRSNSTLDAANRPQNPRNRSQWTRPPRFRDREAPGSNPGPPTSLDPPIDVNWQFEGAQAALREASSRGSTKVR